MNTKEANKMSGRLVDEWGETVGCFWYRDDIDCYCLNWLHVLTQHWTLEGIKEWAEKLEYQVWFD